MLFVCFCSFLLSSALLLRCLHSALCAPYGSGSGRLSHLHVRLSGSLSAWVKSCEPRSGTVDPLSAEEDSDAAQHEDVRRSPRHSMMTAKSVQMGQYAPLWSSLFKVS